MCYRSSCNAVNSHELNTRQPVLNVCREHLEEIAELIQQACTQLTADQALDYAKIWIVMNDRAVIDAALTHLGDKISAYRAKVADSDEIQIDEMPILHFLLKSYEEKFGFGRDCLLTGILTAEAFLEQLTEAYSTCDFGADADHGAFTHRLQWFVIMYAATGGQPEDGTTDAGCLQGSWKTPIVGLFKMLGDAKTFNRLGLPKSGGHLEYGTCVWAVLLDLGGGGGFNHPDTFHAAVRGRQIGNAALQDEILEVQRGVVKRRLRVLNNLQFIGAVKIGNRDSGEGKSEMLSKRDDLIDRAIVGGNLVTFMRYRDVTEGEMPTGEFLTYGSTPTGNFYAGDGSFAQEVSKVAIKNLAKSLIEGGRWKAKYPNLLVRNQRLNSLGQIVTV